MNTYPLLADASDLVGRMFSFASDGLTEARLGLWPGMTIGHGSIMDTVTEMFGSVFVVRIDESAGYAGYSSLLVFALANGRTTAEISSTGSTILPVYPTVFTVTDVFEFDLASGESYVLGYCEVGGEYDRNVVAIIGPPDSYDDRGQLRAARRAWRYTANGLVEVDAPSVTCEVI